MNPSIESPRPPIAPAPKKGPLAKSAGAALWLVGAVGLGFCWGIVETFLIRTVLASGAYFNRDIYSAVTGRVVFYGAVTVTLFLLTAFVIILWKRVRKRPVTIGAAAKRALVAVAAVAAFVNAALCFVYFWQGATNLTMSNPWKLL